MLREIKKFLRKHIHHGKGGRGSLPANPGSAPPAFLARSTPPPRPYRSGPYQMPERNRVYNGSHSSYSQMMERRRTGSAEGYLQSLGDVRVTNPDLAPASSSTSLASTSSNLSNYDPAPLNNLIIASYHRKSSPERASTAPTTPSSRLSVADEFLPMNDHLTAAIFTAQASNEGTEDPENEFEAESPRGAMNGPRMNPPSKRMASPPSEGSCSPLDGSAVSDEESNRMPVRSTPTGIASRRSSSLGFLPGTREVTSEDSPYARRPCTSSESTRRTPLAEHLQSRIRQRRSTDRAGPLTTAEFPENLQTLGPYARFPDFTHSSDYTYPHDVPFAYSSEDVRAQGSNAETETSANLTRPPIANYTMYSKSGSTSLFADHPDDPDRDIYNQRIKLERAPILFMHTRYPRHLPAQLVVGAPFPSRGPVTSLPFSRRMSHSFVGAPRRHRVTKARTSHVKETVSRCNSRRSQGSISASSPSQRIRKYHAYVYNSTLKTARHWNDYTIIESSRENSVADAAVVQSPEPISADGLNSPLPPASHAIVPQQQHTASATTTPTTPSTLPNRNLSIPRTERRRSANLRHGYARLRLRRAARLEGIRPEYQLAAMWLEQNNTNAEREFVNIP